MSGQPLTARERNWLGDQGQAQIERKHDALVAENQRLRDALEIICDIGEMRDAEVARAALAGTPSEDT
jgi:hypothetical protein